MGYVIIPPDDRLNVPLPRAESADDPETWDEREMAQLQRLADLMEQADELHLQEIERRKRGEEDEQKPRAA